MQNKILNPPVSIFSTFNFFPEVGYEIEFYSEVHGPSQPGVVSICYHGGKSCLIFKIIDATLGVTVFKFPPISPLIPTITSTMSKGEINN